MSGVESNLVRPGRADGRGERRWLNAVVPNGALGTALLLFLLAGCGPTAEQREAAARAAETGFRGVVLEHPPPPADFTLTDTHGRPFHLAGETRGYVTLLFFGYTHCPDVCPVQMANLAAVLDDLPYSERSRFKVVFVTTDPDRDTPERLRDWLDLFDRDFVGLRGALERVNEIQGKLGLPPAVLMEARGEDDYLVGHASQVVVLSPDGRPRVVYPFGIRQYDWGHDLPLLERAWSSGSATSSPGRDPSRDGS